MRLNKLSGAVAVIDAGGETRPTGVANGIRSMRGAFGALILLLALPITIAVGMVAPDSSKAVIHFALGIGTLLIGLAVFDFATPRWMGLAACGAQSCWPRFFSPRDSER
jgi:hypothetical protein